MDFNTSSLHQAWREEMFGRPSLAGSDPVEELEEKINDTEIRKEVGFNKPTLTCQDHAYHALLARTTVEEIALQVQDIDQ